MEGQTWHEKKKYENQAQLDKKHQNHSSKLFLVGFKDVSRPRCPGVPEGIRHDEIEESEYDADDGRAKEKVPEENDFPVVHYP